MLQYPCRTTYYTVLPACSESPIIQIDIGLTPLTEYQYVLTTPFGKTYQAVIGTNVQGTGVITLADLNLPEGLLNPWLKLFQLTFYTIGAVPPCDPVTFTICDVVYDNIAIKFVEKSGASLPIIGCQCAEVVP